MADMKFKFTIQPYQTEVVDSVVSVFAGPPFNERFTYRRDVHVEQNLMNYTCSDEELDRSCSLDGAATQEMIRITYPRPRL